MKPFVVTCMAAVLLGAGFSPANAAASTYTCSYRLYENGQPVVRRIEYVEATLQAAMARFEAFLADLRAQDKHPQHLGCR
ncbi:hypothetical protein ABB28_15480 [Stenotrophomonas chelatiphaga]|jgi:hypothetical protein|uniref:Uncharacterized protein n=1 Tax=Stenotrophomonas chelatiphaga TaxID=517011 RepID=A0A0R0CVG1_9GAMM|nr:hypothetical protein [Stenotrophomonas chelatiphaga]KRG70362.1 hypothetical protein ABB28_15480 [Stenotrophomonas chelatiphaga]MCS4232430.1 hypothetical protein [Stenotrophomonas chelatiphaga]ROQ42312.1 hypothetical protein EDF77_1777 [Stenotrophomonas maltophilia]